MRYGIEAASLLVTVIAVAGVVLNNRRRRACFILWFFSNGISLAIHLASGLWGLALRDAIFFVLAVEGFYRWGKASAPPAA